VYGHFETKISFNIPQSRLSVDKVQAKGWLQGNSNAEKTNNK